MNCTEAVKKYKGPQWNWYDVACDLAAGAITDVLEDRQQFLPSKDTYKKITTY